METIKDALEAEAFLLPVSKVSVKDEIARGGFLYQQRKARKKFQCTQDVKSLYNSGSKQHSDYALWKLHSYKEPNYTCTGKEHINSFMINRDILSRTEHISLLAQARKVKSLKPNVKYKYHKVYPISCTTRIARLALPTMRRTLETLNSWGKVLSLKHLENLKNTLRPKNICKISDAISFYNAERKIRRQIRKTKLKKMRLVKRKICQIEREKIKNIISVLAEVMQDYLVEKHNYFLPHLTKMASEVIFKNVCELSGYSIPLTDNEDPLQDFFNDLSQNLAVWIVKFMENCGYNETNTDGTYERTSLPEKECNSENFIEEEQNAEEDPNNEDSIPEENSTSDEEEFEIQ